MAETGIRTIGIPRETRAGETRVAAVPETVKKLAKKGFRFRIEKNAGLAAGFCDEDFAREGGAAVEFTDAKGALGADVVFKIHKPSAAELPGLKSGALLVSLIEPYAKDGTIEKLAEARVDCLGLELVPRTSRAQAMDVLSSQANIAGYRAVIEACSHYGRFFPMMMTSAGSAKPARLIVLGAGVAGLQAIGTAKRLGAVVEAYDVRAEVKEQIQSLGAKFIELELGEEGSGAGGYAKELSEAAKARQQQQLTEKLKKADIIISTANIPGRKAPVLITEDAVLGMRQGSVIVDMAAASGGNCPLSEADRVVKKHGVTLVGITNFPALVASDASAFFSRNILNLMALLAPAEASGMQLNLADDIIAAALITHQGSVRSGSK